MSTRTRASARRAAIAFGHLDVRQQMMREQDRLGRLDVGRAGQDRGPLAFRKCDQGPLEREQREIEVVDRPTRPEAQVRRDLVVARTPGVELAGQRPDLLEEGRLHVHVDILEGGVPVERPGRRVAREGHQAVGEAGDLVDGQQPGPTESADVRDRARDVVGGEGGVDLDRAGEVRHARIRVTAEPPAPGPHRPSVVMAQCYPPAWPATGGGRVARGTSAPPPDGGLMLDFRQSGDTHDLDADRWHTGWGAQCEGGRSVRGRR